METKEAVLGRILLLVLVLVFAGAVVKAGGLDP